VQNETPSLTLPLEYKRERIRGITFEEEGKRINYKNYENRN